MFFGWKRFNFITMIILYFKSVPAAAVYRTVMSVVNALTPTLSIIVTISMHIGNIANNFGQIRNFLRFIEMPSDNRLDADLSRGGAIVLQNVVFRYPNSEKDSLKNINLTINPGETIAIVGENGAGKTTLVKMLTGLYKPTQGIVTIDGNNVTEINYRFMINF